MPTFNDYFESIKEIYPKIEKDLTFKLRILFDNYQIEMITTPPSIHIKVRNSSSKKEIFCQKARILNCLLEKIAKEHSLFNLCDLPKKGLISGGRLNPKNGEYNSFLHYDYSKVINKKRIVQLEPTKHPFEY